MNPTIARRRLGPVFTTQNQLAYSLAAGRRAREEARIAELLGPAGLVFLQDLLAASS